MEELAQRERDLGLLLESVLRNTNAISFGKAGLALSLSP